MDKKSLQGKVQTVLGLVDSDELGFTITHEHILSDARGLIPKFMANSKMGRNLNKTNVDSSIREAALFKEAGGGTIVDVMALPNPGRNPQGLALIAEETGINIIMGISYYIERSYTPDMDNKSVDDIARQYLDEITNGIGETGIKPGIIGEAGCSWPMTENERKCLQAAALAQSELRCQKWSSASPDVGPVILGDLSPPPAKTLTTTRPLGFSFPQKPQSYILETLRVSPHL